jgi:hypothetical protein
LRSARCVLDESQLRLPWRGFLVLPGRPQTGQPCSAQRVRPHQPVQRAEVGGTRRSGAGSGQF